jgi:hypothetical protein
LFRSSVVLVIALGATVVGLLAQEAERKQHQQ